jgi:hypothetical protein
LSKEPAQSCNRAKIISETTHSSCLEEYQFYRGFMHSLFPSHEDWKERVLARIDVAPHASDDGEVFLQCDRWVASSLLQKAIRRGQIQFALPAAFRLHQFDRASVWRRLMIIAVEDIGAAEPDALIETVAIATSPSWRSRYGERESLAHTVCRLTAAPKDRSADYLISTAESHPSLSRIRENCRLADIGGRLAIAGDASRPLPVRALGVWFSSGIEARYGPRIGAGDLVGLARRFIDLGAREDLVYSTVLAAKRTRETLALMVPLIWLESRNSRSLRFSNDPFPEYAVVDGVPTYAFDKHTRLGLRAFQKLIQESKQLRACLDQFVSKQSWRTATQMAAFYTDAYLISRRLDWSLSRSLQALGIESDFCRVGVPPEVVAPLRKVLKDDVGRLNKIRRELWRMHLKSMRLR